MTGPDIRDEERYRETLDERLLHDPRTDGRSAPPEEYPPHVKPRYRFTHPWPGVSRLEPEEQP